MRRWISVGALLAGAAMVLSACGSGSSGAATTVTVVQTPTVDGTSSGPVTLSTAGDPSTRTTDPTPSSATAPQARVVAEPAFGSTDVAPADPITLMAFHSEIVQVQMTGDDGSTIAGEISADKRSWANTEPLDYGVTYTLTGEAMGADGHSVDVGGDFTTVDPVPAQIDGNGMSTNAGSDAILPAYMQIPDGGTVGIAAPIIVTFAGPVADRAAAEKHMHVTVNGGEEIEGSWGWMLDEDIHGKGVKQSRVHFRPKEFWPAFTKVHVELLLKGVNYGSGWGQRDIIRDFSIGPNLKVEADVDSHRLLVIQDDEIIKNFPVSYGLPADADPGRTTVSGIHIVQDFSGDPETGAFTMCNPKYHYCDSTQYWGVRINNNGEFIHVNKQTEASGLLGKANVSHGCINMGMADGKLFYDMMYYGVPVIVENTGVEMSYSDYVWDWAVSWEEWKGFSAL